MKGGVTIMFWERFYGLCLKRGKKPNPVGKEIGLSSNACNTLKVTPVPLNLSLHSR